MTSRRFGNRYDSVVAVTFRRIVNSSHVARKETSRKSLKLDGCRTPRKASPTLCTSTELSSIQLEHRFDMSSILFVVIFSDSPRRISDSPRHLHDDSANTTERLLQVGPHEHLSQPNETIELCRSSLRTLPDHRAHDLSLLLQVAVC